MHVPAQPTAQHRTRLAALQRRAVRLTASPWSWLALNLAAVGVLIFSAAVDLANHRYVSGDETWIMSVAYDLVNRHTFGSTMWAGFYGADRHWFISMPVLSFAQAAVFELFGPGIAQARLVALLAGIGLLSLASWFAFRNYGLAVAAVTSAFLLLGRATPSTTGPGIALVEMSRLARYDLLAMALFWLVIVLLAHRPTEPTTVGAIAIGITSGLAALTQFFGAFAIAVAVVFWATEWRHRPVRRALPIAVAVFFATVMPYCLYILRYWDDFAGQTTLKHDRYAFNDPTFYVRNVLTEYRRVWYLVHPPFPGGVGFGGDVVIGVLAIAAVGAALAVVDVVRERRRRRLGDTILLLSFAVPAALFALIDQTKGFDYAYLLEVPFFIAASIGWCGLVRRIIGWERSTVRSFAGVAAVVVSAFVVLTGVGSLYRDRQHARETNAYMDVGRQIDGYFPPNATVLGPDRWWWALRRHPYYSMVSMFHQESNLVADGQPAAFAALARRYDANYVVLNDSVESWFTWGAAGATDDFYTWLRDCTSQVASWVDPKYGPIRIYRITTPAGDPACGT